MKDNVIKIIFLIISLGLFIAMIVITNDNIKDKVDTSKLVPIIAVLSIALIAVLLIRIRIKKS
ncbi:hypothetical protein [Clostridium sp. 'White wine YQ']|uniref:hypothetical protein n=1 Tax=Clostridium sp. 'White wine YQ' TaxID=3027474 RepID=UPI002365E538|nr:hypothetical protein [Clostridium sp. 'White wine YQ']MDD7793893.1 hypothetical protein [Clostridium sp. 'White wine YQ']